jgi:hypothetical protein
VEQAYQGATRYFAREGSRGDFRMARRPHPSVGMAEGLLGGVLWLWGILAAAVEWAVNEMVDAVRFETELWSKRRKGR